MCSASESLPPCFPSSLTFNHDNMAIKCENTVLCDLFDLLVQELSKSNMYLLSTYFRNVYYET